VAVYSTLSSVSPSVSYADYSGMIQKTHSAIRSRRFKQRVTDFISGGTANPMVAFSTVATVKASREEIWYQCTPRS
jgi:hypothetical protein